MSLFESRIGLFIGNDLSSSILLKRLIPDIQRFGWRVKVFLPQNKPLALTADYRLREFYQHERLLSNGQDILDQYPISYGANCLSYNALSKVFDVPIEPVRDINDELFIKQIDQELDAVLSIRCLQIFRPPLIDLFQQKGRFIWNLHSGALPECRGCMPIFWTINNDIPKATLSLHRISPKIDQGEVLAEKCFDYSSDKSLLEVSCDSIEYAAPLLRSLLESKDGSELKPMPQRSGRMNYYSYPKSNDLDLFFKSGKSMLPPDPIHYIASQLIGDESSIEKELQDDLRKLLEKNRSNRF